jgi:hypothetical protein
MIWPMPPFTRRSFALLLLITPMACLGCGGESVPVNAKAGEKRRQMIEDLQKRAELKRKSGANKAPQR